MATREVTTRRSGELGDRVPAKGSTPDETKLSLKTTEFWAMVAAIAAILVAAAVSDSLGDVRAWTLVTAVVVGYMISRGLAKAGSKYFGSDDPLRRDER
jgi:hypothetical protein